MPTPPDSAGFKDRIAHFTWPWFAATMSTGALAVVIANTPNTFTGLRTIGNIFFTVDLISFALFTIAMSLRAFWFPRRFLASINHPVEVGTHSSKALLVEICCLIAYTPDVITWLTNVADALLRVGFVLWLILGLGLSDLELHASIWCA